jgi:hypothetical protein
MALGYARSMRVAGFILEELDKQLRAFGGLFESWQVAATPQHVEMRMGQSIRERLAYRGWHDLVCLSPNHQHRHAQPAEPGGHLGS